MKILAFDSSNLPLTVGIIEDDKILTEQIINIKRNHSIQLMPAIDEALKQTNLTLKDIDRIAVAAGPGSYTGLRIAVTVAKSLAWAQDIELVGLSSLKVLAANSFAKDNTYIVPIFDARRKNIYTGLYRRNEKNELIQVEEDTHIASEKWAAYLATLDAKFELVGQDAYEFYEVFQETLGDRVSLASPTQSVPKASHLAFLSQQEEATPIHKFVPTYLKLAEAEENWLEANPDFKGEDWVEKV